MNQIHQGLRKILMIEDDPRIADFVSRGLRAEGYLVEVMPTGREGLLAGRDTQFRTILLDIGLPDINGQQVCEQLRSEGITTPILMLTARDAIPDKVKGLKSGADDYMTKPFSFEELLARVEALLRRAEMEYGEDNPEVKIADLLLNRQTHEVSRAGRSIELTAKEYNLLELLMISGGKLVSRARILEQVWGYSSDPLTNVVDVYIRQLRKKIDEGYGVKLIKTVRGFGYRLDTFSDS
jgi:DNA-binding response OmpR family regulator